MNLTTSNINPEIFLLYQNISDYFENPKMYKLREDNGYSGYFTKIISHLGIEKRYIICFVKNDRNPINTVKNMKDISWNMIHTRTLQDNYNIPTHNYKQKRIEYLNKTIELNDKVYECKTLPIKVSMLGDGNYKSSATFLNALETYNTMVMI